MALELKKNKEINLTKSAPSLKVVRIGLAWDEGADLDASAILLDENNKLVDGTPVYYGNLSAAGIQHSGDARDGEAEGDDESIVINLDEVDPRVKKAVISITSYSDSGPVTFGSTSNPVARLYDGEKVLIEAKLDEEAAFGTAMEFVELQKNDEGQWIYKNISETAGQSDNGLSDIIAKYK